MLIRLLEVLAHAAEVERFPERLTTLRRPAGLALGTARGGTSDSAGLGDCEKRHRAFVAALDRDGAFAAAIPPGPTRDRSPPIGTTR